MTIPTCQNNHAEVCCQNRQNFVNSRVLIFFFFIKKKTKSFYIPDRLYLSTTKIDFRIEDLFKHDPDNKISAQQEQDEEEEREELRAKEIRIRRQRRMQLVSCENFSF